MNQARSETPPQMRGKAVSLDGNDESTRITPRVGGEKTETLA